MTFLFQRWLFGALFCPFAVQKKPQLRVPGTFLPAKLGVRKVRQIGFRSPSAGVLFVLFPANSLPLIHHFWPSHRWWSSVSLTKWVETLDPRGFHPLLIAPLRRCFHRHGHSHQMAKCAISHWQSVKNLYRKRYLESQKSAVLTLKYPNFELFQRLYPYQLIMEFGPFKNSALKFRTEL